VRSVVALLEGRVGVVSCLACIAIGAPLAIVISVNYSPLIGVLVALLVESVCAATRGATRLVYRFPRFHERLVSLSPVVTMLALISYYMASGHEKIAGLIAASMILMYASMTPGTETAVNLLLVAAALLLEAHKRLGGIVYLAFSLFPLLVATGYTIATLIYREAAGIT